MTQDTVVLQDTLNFINVYISLFLATRYFKIKILFLIKILF